MTRTNQPNRLSVSAGCRLANNGNTSFVDIVFYLAQRHQNEIARV